MSFFKKHNKKYRPYKYSKPDTKVTAHLDAPLVTAPLAADEVKASMPSVSFDLPAQIHPHIHASAVLVISATADSATRPEGSWVELTLTHPSGSATTLVAPTLVESIASAPEGFIEKHFGLSYEQYLDWLDNAGAPRCAQLKNDGQRCKNNIGGRAIKSPKQFLALNGGTCSVHGGLKAGDVSAFLADKGLTKDAKAFTAFYTV